MIATFIFVIVILCIKKYNPSDNGLINCGAIALTLYGMIKMIVGQTGGCLNPAVAITQTVFQSIVYKRSGIPEMSYSSMPIYIFACSIGGCLAGTFILTKLKLAGDNTQNYSELDAPEAEKFI